MRWLKTYMPRSLYGRAALILVLPVVVVQITVSVIFINRHFEDVTYSMVSNVTLQLQSIQKRLNQATTKEQAQQVARALEQEFLMDIELPVAEKQQSSSGLDEAAAWFDFTGGIVVDALRDGDAQISSIELIERSEVRVMMPFQFGAVDVQFPRGRVSARNPHQLLVLMVVFGTVMTFISYLFLRNQLRPIKRMAAAAEAFGKGRIIPYAPSGATEVRSAGLAFLAMRQRIERFAQSRTMMLSTVSHDLRTPLTRLRLGLALLDDDEAALLQQDVDDMQKMLDGFLDFARGDTGDEACMIVPQELLMAAVDNARRTQGVRASCEVICEAHFGADEPLLLREQALSRALDNLISNAMRYGTVVIARAVVSQSSVSFCIEDNGAGIPELQREQAVRPFVRLDAARNQDHGGGVGLGLSIVNDIARAHGGTLRLGTSEALGGLKAELIVARFELGKS